MTASAEPLWAAQAAYMCVTKIYGEAMFFCQMKRHEWEVVLPRCGRVVGAHARIIRCNPGEARLHLSAAGSGKTAPAVRHGFSCMDLDRVAFLSSLEEKR